MYLSKIHIENYKCWKDTTINFEDGVNSIVGKNGVGKTAIIEAVKYLLYGQINLTKEIPKDAIISCTIFDQGNIIGRQLFELIKADGIPTAFLPVFSDAFQSSGNPATLTFVRNKDYFYLGIFDVVFVGKNIVKFADLKEINGNDRSIHTVTKEDAGESKNLSEFVERATRSVKTNGNNKLSLQTDFCNNAFNILRSSCFFINEMRDLQAENREKETKVPEKIIDVNFLPIKSEDATLNQLLDGIISSSTFISKLNDLNRSTKANDKAILVDFEERCASDDPNLKIAPHSENSAFDMNDRINLLQIYDKSGNRLFTNESFPSGVLEKIFFNFALSYSRNGLLFIEEPETHMHPLMQKTFIEELKKRKGQTILTTHSPEFVGFDIRIIRLNGNGDARSISYYTINNDDFEATRGFYELDKRIFFSDFALFVEGDSEDLMLPAILDEIQDGNFLSRKNILFINMEGDAKHKLYHNILQLMKFPHMFIIDSKGRTANKLENGKFSFDGEDFDKLYTSEACTAFGYSKGSCNKANFALKILLDHYKRKKPMQSYFTPNAWNSFKIMMDSIKAEIGRISG